MEMACRELQRLQALHDSGELALNAAGIELIRRDYHPDKVQADLLRRWKEVIWRRQARLEHRTWCGRMHDCGIYRNESTGAK